MRTTKLFAAILVAGLIASACQQDPDYVLPAIKVESEELSFAAETEQTLAFTATRDWRVLDAPEWVTVTPDKGDGSTETQRVRVSVTPNAGYNRSGEFILTIGLDKARVAVSQPGAKGDEANRYAYRNDFDKEVAEQKYGTSGTSWPYLDQFEGWKNEKGTGVNEVEYAFASISARSNSKSDSNYSDYAGSGGNNLLFGSAGNYLKIGKIKVNESNYTLSFGSEKYLNSGDSMFSHSEFHAFVSNDGEKWVELSYAFPDEDKSGRWDVASSTFTLPSGTASLYLYFKADVASAYRLDDVKLEVADASGTAIDFSKGIALDSGSSSGGQGGGGSQGGGGETTEVKVVTVAQFNAAPDSDTQKYQLTGTVTGSTNTQYGNFDLEDATGKVYVYGLTKTDLGYGAKNDNSFESLGIKAGDTVTIIGYRANYNDKIEVVNAYYVSHTSGGGQGGNDNPPASGDTASGNGTLASPYNPAGAAAAASALASGAKTESKVYVKGKISSIKFTFSAKYGTATFNISEDGSTNGTQFTCYSILYFNDASWKDGDKQIAVNDEVIVYGLLTNYNGNTPETSSNEACLYSLNGKTE